MKHILIPIDFSDTGNNALEYALELARISGADCTLLHAWEVPYDLASQVENRVQEIQRNAKQELEVLLQQIRTEPRYEQLILGCRLEEGKPERVILDVAEETAVDLVVMGLSNPKRVEAFISGNIGAEVLDRSKVPVLAIPAGVSFIPPKEIIYASELREDDFRKLEDLSRWAKLFNARLRIVHVSEENTHEEKSRFREFIEEVEVRITYPYVTEEWRMADGVEEGILSMVAETDGVIVAMTHHHKSFLKKMFGHSHTLTIASKIQVPLLVYLKEK